jgi:hypothetical protein
LSGAGRRRVDVNEKTELSGGVRRIESRRRLSCLRTRELVKRRAAAFLSIVCARQTVLSSPPPLEATLVQLATAPAARATA